MYLIAPYMAANKMKRGMAITNPNNPVMNKAKTITIATKIIITSPNLPNIPSNFIVSP